MYHRPKRLLVGVSLAIIDQSSECSLEKLSLGRVRGPKLLGSFVFAGMCHGVQSKLRCHYSCEKTRAAPRLESSVALGMREHLERNGPASRGTLIIFARDLQERLGILALLALPAPFRICKLQIPLAARETDPVSSAPFTMTIVVVLL